MLVVLGIVVVLIVLFYGKEKFENFKKTSSPNKPLKEVSVDSDKNLDSSHTPPAAHITETNKVENAGLGANSDHVAATNTKDSDVSKAKKGEIDSISVEELSHLASIAGIKTVPVSSTPTEFKLMLKIIPKERCLLGDLDVINKDLAASDNPKLILSIEPLLQGDNSINPVIQRLEHIDTGFSASISIPKPPTKGKDTQKDAQKNQDSLHLGLFICKDSEQEGRCNSKDFRDIEEVNNEHLNQNDPARSTPNWPIDKIYVFQYLLFDGQHLSVLGKNLDEEAVFEALDSYVKAKLLKSLSMDVLTDSMQRVRKLTTTIRSVEFNFDQENQIELFLPKYSKNACKFK